MTRLQELRTLIAADAYAVDEHAVAEAVVRRVVERRAVVHRLECAGTPAARERIAA